MAEPDALTDAEIEDIERLEKEATRAPWWISENDGAWCAGTGDDGRPAVHVADTDMNGKDEYLALTARNALPRLLQAAREANRLRGQVETLRFALQLLNRCEAIGKVSEYVRGVMRDAIAATEPK